MTLSGYAIKYGKAIWGRLTAMSARTLDDTELEQILGPCVCGHFLVPAAKELRDAGLLYFRDGVLTLQSPHVNNKPLAAPGLISYRYRQAFGFVMIGARDVADALSEANRSLTASKARVDQLEVWNGSEYVNVV